MAGINWSEISQQIGFGTQKAMWQDFYTTRHMSMAQLAKRFAVSINVIRDALIRNEIAIRERGGPNNVKVEDLDELRKAVDERGVLSVAREKGIDATTIYKRLYYNQGLKKRPLVPDKDVPPMQDPVEAPGPDENQ